MEWHKRIAISLICTLLILNGCAALKTAKPLVPLKEYEKMIAGRLDADYVGNKNCLNACHYHDKINTYFEASTMGAQLSPESGMPLVDCESCHGPGSLAIEGITPEKVDEDAKQGKQTACNYKALIDFKTLPSEAMSLICLKCHSSHALFNLHNWNAGPHAQNDVACSDCHPVHKGADLVTSPPEVQEMCLKCHQSVRAEFTLPSRHPVLEKRMYCNDCHDPHGSVADKLLRKATVKETCGQCHPEKAGPFVYQHADVIENCTTCHMNHGSVNQYLHQARDPFLCLECHSSHILTTTTTTDSKRMYNTRCTDCHPTIHGTDIPSVTGTGRFTK